ncbi:MAG: hypothetical protein WC707_03825 [Candidatus Babeliaceae bacterium]
MKKYIFLMSILCAPAVVLGVGTHQFAQKLYKKNSLLHFFAGRSR